MQGSYCAPVKFKGKDRRQRWCRRWRLSCGRKPRARGPRCSGAHACTDPRTAGHPCSGREQLGLRELRAPGFGRGPGGEGLRYLHSSKRAGADRGGGRLGKQVKENKLFKPLNIHDSSFAQANRKRINPFTTLLNALKKKRRRRRRMRVPAGSGASGEEYENIDPRRLEA